MKCPTCGLDARRHERHCPNCLTELGFPNVRDARHPDEIATLEGRRSNALAEASRSGTLGLVDEYARALEGSVVVVCRQYSDVYDLLRSENELYASFATLVESLKRRPSAAQIDLWRRQADALFFPYYEKEIRFAALSLDGSGAAHYGPVSIVLAPSSISQRTSFFEKNTVEFAIEHDLGPGRPVPFGYRSDWASRSKLAVAKGQPRILPSTTSADFPRLLLAGDEFIEAHIYGPLHRMAIERLVIRRPSRAAEIAFVSAIEDIIARDGLSIQVHIV